LEEVLGMSDRVVVMHEDRSVGTLDIADATQEKIMALATGTTAKAKPKTRKVKKK
jgi:ABC-type sugar transport system ATPase subunit